MELIKKHKLIFGIIAVQLIVLPLLLLLVRQQQETRTGAVAATTLSFLPNSGATSPINANINQEFTVDLMLNPGTNLVSLAKLDITYDPTVIALSSSTPVVVNSTAFPVIVEGPIYTNGRVQIVVSVGSDQTKVIQTTTKVLTIKFRGTSASQTQIGFGTNNASICKNKCSSNKYAIGTLIFQEHSTFAMALKSILMSVSEPYSNSDRR